jgi:hypothetical protein
MDSRIPPPWPPKSASIGFLIPVIIIEWEIGVSAWGSPPEDLRKKHCLHELGSMTRTVANGVATEGYRCTEGFTSIHYLETWKEAGRTFESLKEEEYRGYCDAEFISMSESNIRNSVRAGSMPKSKRKREPA